MNVEVKELEKENAELKQENEGLKQELVSYKHPDVVTLLTSWRTGKLDKIYNKIANERDNYKQALEEIREDMENDTTCESRECGCDDYAECLNCIKETILNKINEVLESEGE